ncbi:MAG: 9-O-acetylesterase [Phycisphaerae bacterium]
MNRSTSCVFKSVLAVLVPTTAGPAMAEVRLPAILGDHMVVQQGLPVPVWGWADAGEEVTVTLGDQKKSAQAGADGKWLVRLDALSAKAEPVEITIAGKNRIVLKDVLIGEVWICSGQSNMQWPVSASKNKDEEIAAADYPRIRLFSVPRTMSEKPLEDTKGEWTACTPRTVPDFSAVGYFFGRDLHKQLDVPVGLIHTSWGGTPAESWTSRAALEADADFKPILDRWQQARENYPAVLAKWKEEADKAQAEGKALPRRPTAPDADPHRPCVLFNAMIAPLVPVAHRGVIWYQGESNAGRAYQYRKLLPAMIKSWRDAFGREDSAFLIVSLANFTPVKDEPGESEWAELREAQAMTAAMPHNGLAITIDVGEANDIHPKDKQTVGNRLMRQALRVAYGKRTPAASGPVFDSMEIDGRTVRLKFKNARRLVAKGGELKGFAVAGEDRKFYWAKAAIEGNVVVLTCDQVPQPKAVRYAWANNPVCNLYNAAGLPAVPFRTDDWPGITVNNK